MTSFVARYGRVLDPADLEVATAFLRLPRRTPLEKRFDIIRYGLLFGSKRRNIGLMALV